MSRNAPDCLFRLIVFLGAGLWPVCGSVTAATTLADIPKSAVRSAPEQPSESDDVAPVPPPSHAAKGTEKSYTIVSRTVRPWLGEDHPREITVWTPPGYDDAANQNTRYPVMYLLHGSPGNPHNFQKRGRWYSVVAQAVDDGTIIPPILVMPDGNYIGNIHGDSEWVNSADGKDKFEDFITMEVVPWTDSHFRTSPKADDRILGGVSEGAYGAINIGLHNTNLFHKLFAFSGYYVTDGSGWARDIMGYDPAYSALKSPLTQLKKGALGLTDSPSIEVFLGAGDKENATYATQLKQLSLVLKQAGVHVRTDILVGKHGWSLWTKLLDETLVWLDGTTKSDAIGGQSAPAKNSSPSPALGGD